MERLNTVDFYEKEFPKLQRGLTKSICCYLMDKYFVEKSKSLKDENERLKKYVERKVSRDLPTYMEVENRLLELEKIVHDFPKEKYINYEG